jgi:sugar lactone lactonase YvrE
MESGVFHLTLSAGGDVAAHCIARASHSRPRMRFNDGRCDRQGRFRAGTMMLDMAHALDVGAVYACDGEGEPEPLVRELFVPSGLAFSPDGRTMYLSDSHPKAQTIWRFDYDAATGRPSKQRLFVDMRPLPGRPDGAAVDEDGCYWICANDAGLVHRFTPRGRLDRSLAVPVAKPSMCAFGGAGLDTLFVTSIRPATGLADQPLAGGVFALRPGVRGIAETPCTLPIPTPAPA